MKILPLYNGAIRGFEAHIPSVKDRENSRMSQVFSGPENTKPAESAASCTLAGLGFYKMVLVIGFEPTTYALRMRRSTS